LDVPTAFMSTILVLFRVTICSREFNVPRHIERTLSMLSYLFHSLTWGTAVVQWLRRCATNRKVAGSSIPEEWTLRPTFHHCPPPLPPKQAAIVWIVAHLVAYRLQTQKHLSLNDYMDFLQRARWKEYHRAPKTPTVGRYLHFL